MLTRRTCGGLLIAAGLAIAWPATSARAQFSLGYDSFVYGEIPSHSYYAGQGFPPMYTDPTLGIYADGAPAPYRGLTPYMDPPYGTFPRNGLPVVVNRPVAPVAQPAPAQGVVKKRRGILRRSARK